MLCYFVFLTPTFRGYVYALFMKSSIVYLMNGNSMISDIIGLFFASFESNLTIKFCKSFEYIFGIVSA